MKNLFYFRQDEILPAAPAARRPTHHGKIGKNN